MQIAAAAREQINVEVKQEEEEQIPKADAAPKKIQRKGPPVGVFVDEGDKASGILDPTGKFMLITHPHLLGDEFARRYGTSAPGSPSAGFQEIMDESEAGDSQSAANIAAVPEANTLLAALAAQMVGPINAETPAASQTAPPQPAPTFADFTFDSDFDEEDLGEDIINIEDVIKFDSSDDSDEPTSPIYMPPKKDRSATKLNKIPSFAPANITAFRNNADPNFTSFSNAHFSKLSELTTPVRRTSRKRKAVDSPYSSAHYAGVTPVQRMRDPNPLSTPGSPITDPRPKRRRLMTT